MNDPNESRRESPRVEATFRVRFPSLEKLVLGYTQNLSRGGMFLRTRDLLPLNAVIRVFLALPEGGGEVAVVARVVYARGEAEACASGKPAGMGIEFLDLDAERAERIERFIASRSTDGAPQGLAMPARHPLHLVVVDDDDCFLEHVATPFRARGDSVRTALDGLHGLAACLKDPPEAVLSDVNMPRMDGWQLLRTIRSRPSLSSVAVVFLTSLSGDDERLRGYQLGVDDYVPKTCPQEEIVARLDRVVGRLAGGRTPNVERKTLRGDLEQVTLASLLGFLELERKTGVLFLVGEQTARVFLQVGRPLRVEVDGTPGGSRPLELVFRLLSWPSGQFEFAAQEVCACDEIEMPLGALLLEHARRIDEARRCPAPEPEAHEVEGTSEGP